MGPKEPGDPYSGSGKAAGALGDPGNEMLYSYNVLLLVVTLLCYGKKSHFHALNKAQNI